MGLRGLINFADSADFPGYCAKKMALRDPVRGCLVMDFLELREDCVQHPKKKKEKGYERGRYLFRY